MKQLLKSVILVVSGAVLAVVIMVGCGVAPLTRAQRTPRHRLARRRCSYRAPSDNFPCPLPTHTTECFLHSRDNSTMPEEQRLQLVQEHLAYLATSASPSDTVRLDGGQFPAGVTFEGLTFHATVQFDGAAFLGDVSFAGSHFNGTVSSFRAAHFRKSASFLNTRFEGALFFDNAVFEGPATFDQTRIAERAGAGMTSFREVHFLEGLRIDAAFLARNGTYFNGARFAGRSVYIEADFSGDVSFDGAFFEADYTSIFATGCDQRCTFTEATFRGAKTSIGAGRFTGEVSLAWAQVQGLVLFDSPGFTKEVRLEGIRVFQGGEIVFDDVDMSLVSLYAADVSRMRFIRCQWTPLQGEFAPVRDEFTWRKEREGPPWGLMPALRRKRPWSDAARPLAVGWELLRAALSDALMVFIPYEGGEDWDALERLRETYQGLKHYYASVGDQRMVGPLHARLMQTRWHLRAASVEPRSYLRRQLRKWLSWETLYRMSSGYGESYARAGMLLLVLWSLFAAGYWLLGGPVRHGNLADTIGDALLYSFQAGTMPFTRADFYSPGEQQGIVFRMLHATESIVIPAQFAMFALALRNRFGR